MRANLGDYPRLSDHSDGWLEGAEGSPGWRRGVWHRLRVRSVSDLKLTVICVIV
jgi:hypothetical protein